MEDKKKPDKTKQSHGHTEGITNKDLEIEGAKLSGYDLMTFDTELDEFDMADNEMNGINQILLFVGLYQYL